MRNFSVFLWGAAVSTVIAGPAYAKGAHIIGENSEDLYNTPIEQLAGMDYIVTTASKHEQKILDSTSAIYVINNEDIRRSGATSVAEALRMAPGVDVQRVDNSRWSISIRGFASQFGNKLLVLVDGRSVYSSFFSGVFWDEQNMMLEDVDRIEVIRGPGAALYGANAVNGVINIISKKASATQGNLVTASVGTQQRTSDAVRHGGQMGDTSYRVYAKYIDSADRELQNGSDRRYMLESSRTGFRADTKHSDGDELTIQGDAYKNHSVIPQYDFSLSAPYAWLVERHEDPWGGNLLARYKHAYSNESKVEWQGYIDHDDRETTVLSLKTTTYDASMQHSYSGINGHNLIWGGGVRFIDSDANIYLVQKAESITHIFSAFVQDEITLIPNKWLLTLGTKLEENSYTSAEVQPSVRSLWKLNDTQSVWGAVSRAVRTPSREERDLYLVNAVAAGTPPTQIPIVGNQHTRSEEMVAYELGYRNQMRKNMNFDVTGFYNEYSRLINTSYGASTFSATPVAHNILPNIFTNNSYGETYGVELAPTWNVTDSWSLKGSYSFMEMALHTDLGANAVGAEAAERTAPNHQFSIISYLDLPNNIEIDNSIYYVDKLAGYNVPSYIRADMRIGWKPWDSLELSLVGQNLLDNAHLEGQAEDSRLLTPIPRSVYGKATWKF